MHPQIITPSRFLGSGEVQAGSHSSPALLPVIQPNFYLKFIAEYDYSCNHLQATIPLSSTPSYPVSLVDLPNPDHLTITNNTAMVACFEQHLLHSTFRHSSVSVLIKFCRDFFQRCRSVIFNGSDQ